MAKAELIKESSHFLRGAVGEELSQETAHFSSTSAQVLKFHGMYQQEDRDSRQERKKEGQEKGYMFMLRTKVPGGRVTPAQYLAHDEIASRFANGTLRITARQDFQLHGVLKKDMKEALQTTLILVVWIVFWLGGTIGGAVLQARLIDIGVMSDIDPPWIITIGSSFIGFFAGAYAAVKLGDLTLRKND